MKIIQDILSTNKKIKNILMDVDGVVKDLYKEHSEALKLTIGETNKTNRKKLILKINKLSRSLIGCGLLPTSSIMQKILTVFYSIILLENPLDFYNKYKYNYRKQYYIFEEVVNYINSISPNYNIVFVSLNTHSKALANYGLKGYNIHTTKYGKKELIKTLMKNHKMTTEDTILIGDNYIHDYFPAKAIGIKVLIVNCYNNDLKNQIKKAAIKKI